jgi:hypothetical protein
MREPSRRIDAELAPAREMVDEDDAREGAGLMAWPRPVIGVPLSPLMVTFSQVMPR